VPSWAKGMGIGIGRVDNCQDVREGGDDAVGGGSAVPVFGPPLWDVDEVATLLVELSADDRRDRLVVGHTTSAVGTVAEEVGVESEGAEGDD